MYAAAFTFQLSSAIKAEKAQARAAAEAVKYACTIHIN
jgi:hypothetical protein